MKAWIKAILIILILSAAGFYWLTAGHFFESSGISNCVVVAKEADFTGKWLTHAHYVLSERIPTPECLEKDQRIDKGDGPRKGKVLWAECTFGPDCDDAGMF